MRFNESIKLSSSINKSLITKIIIASICFVAVFMMLTQSSKAIIPSPDPSPITPSAWWYLAGADSRPNSPSVTGWIAPSYDRSLETMNVAFGTPSVTLSFTSIGTVGWTPSSTTRTLYYVAGQSAGVSGAVGNANVITWGVFANTPGATNYSYFDFTYSPPGGFTASGTYWVQLDAYVVNEFSGGFSRCVANGAPAANILDIYACPISGLLFSINVNVSLGGCTDPAASNYNPSATFNDGSCIYIRPGCTDPAAINYNPGANQNDGSCIYAPPSCSITNTLIVGGFTLNWSSANATSASISGIGGVAGSGSRNVGPTNTTYIMTVSGPGGTRSCSTTTVVPPPPVCTSFNFSVQGLNYRLNWTSSNATSASISGLGGVPLSGTRDVAQSAATYTLTLTNSIGATATCSVTTPAPPSCTLTDDFIGGILRIRWTTTSATSISIDNGIGAVAIGSGNRVVSPVVTTTYTATVRNSVGATRTCFTVVIPPPTINITSSSCEQITVSFTGETYNYNLELLVNGSPVVPAITRNNQRAPGSVTFNEVAQFRDFNARAFSVRITNASDSTVTVTSASVNQGPCMTLACAGITVAPAVLEINTPFTITTNFTTNIQMGSRGNPQTYTFNASTNPNIPGVPSPLGSGPINGTTSSPYSSTSSNIPGPGSIGTYTVSYRITVAGNTTNCPPITINFAEVPYIQTFGGSVISGYGIRNTATGVCSVGTGTVRSTIVSEPGNASEFVGSGTQAEVMARGAVTGFRSAITETNRNSTPWSRAFSNVSPARTATTAISSNPLGGNFSASLCADDWFKDKPTAATATTNSINLTAVPTGVTLYNNGGSTRFTGPTPNITGFRKIFVNGNVIIGNASTANQSFTYSNSWNSVADIPMTIIIASGNIFIDDNVNNFDGILVAGGTVFSCSDTSGALPNSTGNISQNAAARAGQGCNTNQLTINGAVVGSQVRLWRTGGTVSRNVSGVSDAYQAYQNGLTRAETYRLSPDVFLALRPGEEPTNGESGRRPFNSLVSLPPPF